MRVRVLVCGFSCPRVLFFVSVLVVLVRSVMNIYTSNYIKARSLDSHKFFVVSISRFVPRDFYGVQWLDFAPSARLLADYKKGLSESEYSERYIRSLGRPSFVHGSFRQLALRACGRDIVLCCYERPEAFCHRHILSDYVFDHFGYRIEELS